MEKEIIWSETAQNQLQKIYKYLSKKSKGDDIPNKVVEKIYNSVTILSTNWEIYELDEMKISNNSNYRAFEIYSYRITYKITLNQIQILRSRTPKKL